MSIDPVIQHLRTNRARWLAGLNELLRIPSISTLETHRPDVLRAAQLVANKLTTLGMNNVQLVHGNPESHPLVRAERLVGKDKPTLLVYAHFDVQPVDPLPLWVTPPFEPTIRDGNLYARGSADDKGQLWILISVVEAYMDVLGDLPVNVKFIFEGEEESSGELIAQHVREQARGWLADVDAVLVLDNGMYAPGLPTISGGLRGIICAELHCKGAKRDLHSGQYGGAAPNAAVGLAKIIASFHTPGGRVRIPGFYKDVKKPSRRELDSWKKLPFDHEDYRKEELGATMLVGDSRYSVHQRLWALPTLEVNGSSAGFTGNGFKTIIPGEATAKISMRLVPGMNGPVTAAAFVDYVGKVSPKYVETTVKILSVDEAIELDLENDPISRLAEAYEQTFGAQTAYVRSGGSIPIAATFKQALGKPIACTGFTLNKCNEHAPNEFMPVENFHLGTEAIARFLWNLGR